MKTCSQSILYRGLRSVCCTTSQQDDAVIKQALDAHIKKVGLKRFNEDTNFLKHADQDPAGEIDENFHTFTEAGIGMTIALFKHHDKNLTAEMAAFLVWSAIMRPGFYDLSEATNQLLDEWRKNSRTNPTQVTADKKMYYGDAIPLLDEAELESALGKAEGEERSRSRGCRFKMLIQGRTRDADLARGMPVIKQQGIKVN